MVFPAPVLLEINAHQLEVAETLIQVGRFVVIFVVARAIAELLVKLGLVPVLLRVVIGGNAEEKPAPQPG
jgi:hypothetical protein